MKPAGGSAFNYVVIALLLGSVWGFFEVFFKDVLGMGGKPFASAIMTGIGVAVMAIGYGMFRKAGMFFMISLFTIMARMIVVPVLGCSPMCRANSVVALALLGASTALAFGVSSRVMKNSYKTGGLWAGAGVFVSGVAFYFGGMACAPCQYLQNFASHGGLVSFLKVEVMYWSLFSALLFYPGYRAGVLVRDAMTALRESRPVHYYAGLVSASFVMMLLTGLILMR